MNTKISNKNKKITDHLNKQLNVVQTTHPQQPDHTFSFKQAAHNTQNVGVTRKSNVECEVYVTVLF